MGRGGRVVFQDISKAKTDEWTSALNAVEASLDLEKKVHEALLDLHKEADSQNDAQLTDFIEGGPQGTGRGPEGDWRLDHQDEEGWRHPWSPHHRQGAPVKEKAKNQGWMISHPNPGMIHTCHPMIILQH